MRRGNLMIRETTGSRPIGAAGLVLLLALGVAPAAAQTPAPARRVEFDQAIQDALANNPTIAQARTAVARADALLAQARAATMPGVSAGVTNVTLDSARGFDGNVTQPQNQFAFTASASMAVLAPTRWAGVNQARDQIDVSERASAETRQQIAIAAAETYLAVITARRQVEVNERAIENARAHLDYAQRRLEGGAGSRLNQLRAAQAVSADEARLAATQLALIRAQEALGVILAANGPVDAGAEPVFDVPATADEATWMAARPDVQFQESVRRAAQRVLRDSWKDWLPTGTASFDPQYITPSGLFQPSRTWRLTFAVTQPVFDGGQRRASEQLRQASLTQSELSLTLTQIQARSEVRTARASIDALQRAVEASRLAAQQADEVLRITTSAFEVGATTNIEVIDAQRSARDAESTAALAEDAVRRARLELLVALGLFPR
ncbi:MAG: TolC family protein [Vicinamibacterales bacterium]